MGEIIIYGAGIAFTIIFWLFIVLCVLLLSCIIRLVYKMYYVNENNSKPKRNTKNFKRF